jgi:GT2 family glycosyltransferase
MALGVAAGVCLLSVAILLELLPGSRRLAHLDTVPPAEGPLPRVSIVFGARDEEANIEEAVRSHLAQDHPDFEVIAIDDRSTDGTSAILARVAAGEPRLQVVRVDALPPGWLGKCHALQRGAEAATGEWILFTDADVVMAPSVLRRVLALATRERLDHLTIAPHARMPGRLLEAFTAAFGVFFSLFTRPWRIPDPSSRAYVGIGAFNLVRASAYRAAGGHAAIRLSVDDDIRLGKVLKRAGLRSALALGQTLIRVDWYPDLCALVRGLEKGVFAGLDYSVVKAVGGTLGQVFLFLWPVAGLAFGGWTAALCGVACVAVAVLYLDQAYFHGTPLWTVALFPVCGVIFLWILWRSVTRTLACGGLDWRGTFYALPELRGGLV